MGGGGGIREGWDPPSLSLWAPGHSTMPHSPFRTREPNSEASPCTQPQSLKLAPSLSPGAGTKAYARLLSCLCHPSPAILARLASLGLSFLVSATLLSSPADSVAMHLPPLDLVLFSYPPPQCLYLLPETASLPSHISWAQRPPRPCPLWLPKVPELSVSSRGPPYLFAQKPAHSPSEAQQLPLFFSFLPPPFLNINKCHSSPSGSGKFWPGAVGAFPPTPLEGGAVEPGVGSRRCLCFRLSHLTA